MNSRIIKDEIKLADGECCIVFDFGCFFPYANFEVLTFEFSLGMEEFDDYKINHRYQNKGYQTISKKYGRKVSKLGYPYVMRLNEQSPVILCIKIGINKQYIALLFLLQTDMTKEKPICGLSLHYIFEENKFYFISNEKAENGMESYKAIEIIKRMYKGDPTPEQEEALQEAYAALERQTSKRFTGKRDISGRGFLKEILLKVI